MTLPVPAEQSKHIPLNEKRVDALLQCFEGTVLEQQLVKQARRSIRLVHPSDYPLSPIPDSKRKQLADSTNRAAQLLNRLQQVRQTHAQQLQLNVERSHKRAAEFSPPPSPPSFDENRIILQSLAEQLDTRITHTAHFIHNLAVASADTNRRVENVTNALAIASNSAPDQNHLVNDWTDTFADINHHEHDYHIPNEPTEEIDTYPDEPFVTPRSKMRKRVAAMSKLATTRVALFR
ncbi:hypothetical protein BWQ96_06551 [Gracilariopsis chorda]|uniref:Uncharacterized protein n=1 Tax=Gracilariopsis chorda TaxID=448386 RepID=A0A2V3INQ8_9FLOR|nr:hypothetical protein BWQ96_06551 [Gracilariopsis chorda]|eukprot:PXF43721.1 hypothetical protein BWQ96_06551 [Gracilariopsis chorda]